jgi:hypothetical protein
MKRLKRIGWQHNGVVSFVWMEHPRRKAQSIWPHTNHMSHHLVRLYIGKLVILRIRQSDDHLKRLGLAGGSGLGESFVGALRGRRR